MKIGDLVYVKERLNAKGVRASRLAEFVCSARR